MKGLGLQGLRIGNVALLSFRSWTSMAVGCLGVELRGSGFYWGGHAADGQVPACHFLGELSRLSHGGARPVT